VVKLLEGIVDLQAPATANQVFSVVRATFNWCIGRGFCVFNGWRRSLRGRPQVLEPRRRLGLKLFFQAPSRRQV